jgi:hypothetical protein
LEQFEALVLSQKPASEPWRPVTDYSFEARKAIEGPHAQLIKDTFQPRLVWDVGCGYGHLVKMLRALDVVAEGMDTQELPPFIPLRRSITDRIVPSLFEGCRGDLVICREVLEHLTVLDVRKAVSNLCAMSSRFVYVTTRFNEARADLLEVGTHDCLDPTHITLLNQDFLRVLFVLEGFKRRADLEQRLDWQKKGRVLVYERAA